LLLNRSKKQGIDRIPTVSFRILRSIRTDETPRSTTKMALAIPRHGPRTPAPATDDTPLRGSPGEGAHARAIEALERAISAIARGDIAARCAAVRAASEAVSAIYLDLDVHGCGGDAETVSRHFGAILGQLLRINLHNDAELARDVMARLAMVVAGASQPVPVDTTTDDTATDDTVLPA